MSDEVKLEQTLGEGQDQIDDNQLAGMDDDEEGTTGKARERRKIEIRFIQDKSRRHITFSKRKAGIMKKLYELSVLTGTQVLLLVVSETGLVYTFTTPKLQPLVTKPEGKNLIQACLNAPEEDADENGDQEESVPPPSHHQQPPPQQQLPPQQQAPQQHPQLGQPSQHPGQHPGPQHPGHPYPSYMPESYFS